MPNEKLSDPIDEAGARVKKGSQWPQIRCGWVTGLDYRGPQKPPTYCRVSSFSAGYFEVDESGIHPHFINQDNCTILRWNYAKADDAVWWEGQWDDGIAFGEIFLSQRPTNDPAQDCLFVFSVSYKIPAVNIAYSNLGATLTGQWTGAFNNGVPLGTIKAVNFPWFFLSFDGMIPCSYGYIRARGSDADNTAPEQWVEHLPPEL